MEMNHIRRGSGKPLLLVHGLGGSVNTWMNILDALAAEREVIAIDLPGHGQTPAGDGAATMDTLADAVSYWLAQQNLTGVDAVGNSMGARLVLELARRRVVGATVALDPGGFWEGWERGFFYGTIALSIRAVRLLQPVMPRITASPMGRALLFAQLSAHPKKLSPDLLLTEMRSFAASTTFNELLRALAFGPVQQGAPSTPGPIVIGWGTKDHLTLPRQAARATERFPQARLHWFEGSGHYSHWDAPDEAVRLILEATNNDAAS